MKFNSQICTTKEQSERLLALGLKKDTADMCWFNDMQKPFCAPYKYFAEKAQDMKWVISPAWSLHRLIEILDIWCLELNFNEFNNPYDQIISYFEERAKGGFINKEYLEE